MLHTPAPIIFSTSLERDLLNSLSTLGFDTGQIVHSVLTDACDATGALWWMLKKRAEKKAVAEPEKDVKQSDIAENGTYEELKHSSRPKESEEKDQEKVKVREGKHRVKGKSSHEPLKTSVTSPSTPPPHSPTIAQARSAPELQFIPPTPTTTTSVVPHTPSTPPRSKSPSSNQNDRAHSLLSPISTSSLTDSINAKSYSSTPGSSLKERDSKEGRDKDKDSVGSKGRKARAGSVSIMQRATTALEAAGLVRKKSTEAVKEEKEREREKSNSGEKRQGSGDEPRASHGSGSNKAKSPPLRAVKDSSAPGTPPPHGEGHPGAVGSPWVFANLKSSPPSTPASSHGDTLGALPNISEHGSKLSGHRNRASLLTTFRMWFREDPKGKRKESAPQLSTQGQGYNSGNRSSPSASPIAGHSRGTVKRRPSSGNRGKAGGTGRRSGNRGKRGSVSSRRSSSVNSKRSSLTSTQMAILESASATQQQYTIPSASSAEQMTPMTRQRSDPSRRSFGSHTPNSERDEYVSRPSSIQSFHNHHRHRKSPSASSAGSSFQVGRTNSPLPKYHRKTGSGSSTRVVRQVTTSVAGKHHAAAIAAAHLRSNSASSNHSLASSRHNSMYELSETEGRRASSPRKSLSRSSFDDGNSTPRRSGATTFVAQKRHTPLSHPNSGGGGYLSSLGRSSWKKSWGREPPGWQTRSAHPSIEVLAILPAAGDAAGPGGSAIRDVFTGRQSFSMGDESDWVDEDDDVSGLVYAGGLGQLPISTPSTNPTSTTPSSSMMVLVNGTHSQPLDSPMISSPPARNMFIRPPPTNSASSKRGPGGLGLPPVNTTGRGSRSKNGGRSPAGRSSPLPNETTFEATDTRGGGRRQIPAVRSGPAFRQAIQEEDEDEEE